MKRPWVHIAHGNPLQNSFLENPTDRGTWWATVHRVAKSRTGLRPLSSSSSHLLKEIRVIDFSCLLNSGVGDGHSFCGLFKHLLFWFPYKFHLTCSSSKLPRLEYSEDGYYTEQSHYLEMSNLGRSQGPSPSSFLQAAPGSGSPQSHQWEHQPCNAGHAGQLRSWPERLLISLAGWQLNLSEGEEN